MATIEDLAATFDRWCASLKASEPDLAPLDRLALHRHIAASLRNLPMESNKGGVKSVLAAAADELER